MFFFFECYGDHRDLHRVGRRQRQMCIRDSPTFHVRVNEETGQTIIAGMGELHLEILIDRMQREFNVAANVGKPVVAYRESIRARTKTRVRFARQTGGRGQFAEVELAFEPGEKGSHFVFENATVGGSVPKEFVPAVEKGVRAVSYTHLTLPTIYSV